MKRFNIRLISSFGKSAVLNILIDDGVFDE
jgi:hypothetical protein